MEVKKGYFFIGLAVLLWSYQPVLMNDLLTKIPLIVISLIRLIVATSALLVIKFVFAKKGEVTVDKKTFIKDSVVLSISLIISSLLFYLGFKNGNSGLGRFLSEGITPLFLIMIMSLLFKEERSSIFNIFSSLIIILAILGVYLITCSDLKVSRIYDYHLLYILAGGIVWSLYLCYYRMNSERIDIKDNYLFVGIAMSLVYLIISIANKEISSLKELTNVNFFALLLLALIVDVGVLFTFYKGINIVGYSKASVVLMLAPLLTTITMGLMMQEHISVLQWIGCGLIFIANIAMVSKDLINEDERQIFY